jgi:hypothetical protein
MDRIRRFRGGLRGVVAGVAPGRALESRRPGTFAGSTAAMAAGNGSIARLAPVPRFVAVRPARSASSRGLEPPADPAQLVGPPGAGPAEQIGLEQQVEALRQVAKAVDAGEALLVAR